MLFRSAVLGLQRQIRAILGDELESGGTYTTLSQLGVQFQKNGTLSIDSGKLSAALSASIGDAAGFALTLGNAIKDVSEKLLGSAGPIANETAGINRSLTDLGKQRSALQNRLVAVQARYMAQFSALDAMMSRMTQTSTFLTQQLNNLPNYYNKG